MIELKKTYRLLPPGTRVNWGKGVEKELVRKNIAEYVEEDTTQPMKEDEVETATAEPQRRTAVAKKKSKKKKASKKGNK